MLVGGCAVYIPASKLQVYFHLLWKYIAGIPRCPEPERSHVVLLHLVLPCELEDVLHNTTVLLSLYIFHDKLYFICSSSISGPDDGRNGGNVCVCVGGGLCLYERPPQHLTICALATSSFFSRIA